MDGPINLASLSEASSQPSPSRHQRRPSLTLSPHLAAHPISVPSRHGSLSNRPSKSSYEPLSSSSSLRRGSRGSFSSLSLSGSVIFGSTSVFQSSAILDEDEDITVDSGAWLDKLARDILLAEDEKVLTTVADTRIEEAVNLLLENDTKYLLVKPLDTAQTPAFFDRKDPAVQDDSRTVAPRRECHYWCSLHHGIHRIAVEDGGVLSHDTVLRYLLELGIPPSILEARINSKLLNLTLHSLISISSSATIVEAMQAMNRYGLRVLGVLAEVKDQTLGSDTSPVLSPVDEEESSLVSVVRGRDCARMVVPSEGKQALTMSLAELIKLVEEDEIAGKERGEERMPSDIDNAGLRLPSHPCNGFVQSVH
uniref:CBS domain-containing protein n=1 Tax=Kwoniella pini CBS 10737 TaxID=1296096 RepID=A0A1B9IA36_9TREE|nr:uncharacterized protein I206_01632 [Kwoniella pini CBS 10737]OCF52343.1 hypothetical protein I206_01632 [Kwoniella pini CBS 10737]